MKSVEEIYQKKELHQHILDRPDSYIGSTKETTGERYIYSERREQREKQNEQDEKITGSIIKKTITYNPGFIKIFDEVLVNAIDQTVREPSTNIIKCNFDQKNNLITVYNNGEGIPVLKHKEYGIYIPELLFGNLLTSSNYDDSQKRIVGGLNGLGAKCANLFSTFFMIETVDSKNGLYYKQTFTNNMYDKTEPIIKKYTKKPFTRISFKPDTSRLGEFTDDTLSLLKKRVVDTIATTEKNTSVYLDDVKLVHKDFTDYINFYFNQDKKIVKIHEKFTNGDFSWDVAVCLNDDDTFEQVSFVNGIDTFMGGKHVEWILGQITKKTVAFLEKKNIKDVKASYIKDNLFLFVRATIINPTFSSQTKEYLSTNYKDFGIEIHLSDNFFTKLFKTGLVERINSIVDFKNKKILSKNSNTSRKTKLNIPKLDDANFAGTVKSKLCTLILTEGDSAKTFAISGLSIIGRDYYGVFPLRGKLLNVREATQAQLLKNEEINNLKKIIGLQHGKKYQNTDSLRYGRIMLLTDADVDALHISGLIINFFHVFWPELLELQDFITSMKTPIIKVNKGKESIEFYSQKEYEKWKKTTELSKWHIKYYKGLGTSTSNEAKDLFKRLDSNKLSFYSDKKSLTDDALLLAFEKKRADDRKKWLKDYSYDDSSIDYSLKKISYYKFVNESLVNFSLSDIIRSIPSIYDGLKPSQRKVLFTLFKNDYKHEIKVAQLGGAVSETTAYHHGEASLYSTIVNMAQDYIGTNNINLLKPNGQFGCLEPNTQILMFSGNIKLAKDIKIGDHLVGDDGLPRRVLRTVSGKDEMYRIKLSSGLEYIVNSMHILTFKIKCHKKLRWNNVRKQWEYLYFDHLEKKMIIRYIKENEDFDLFSTRRKYLQKIYDVSDCDTIDMPIKDYICLDNLTKEFLYGFTNSKRLSFSGISIKGSYNYGYNMIKISKEILCSCVITRYNYIKGFIYRNRHLLQEQLDMTLLTIECDIEILENFVFITNSLGIPCYLKNSTIIIKGDINFIFKNTSLLDNNSCSNCYKISIEPLGLGDFVGWEVNMNNRFLLGNFIVTHNSRLQNGKDAASPRYIFTELNPIVKKLFNQTDFKTLDYINEEGQNIEPTYYVPILPLVLINGAQGIGTGFSTNIPCYNPEDIIENMKRYLKKQDLKDLVPWYKNFTGKIIKAGEQTYNCYGTIKILSKTKLKITELPVGVATEDYIEFIKMFIENENKIIKDYYYNSTDTHVDIDLIFYDDSYIQKGEEWLYKFLKLVKSINTSNMHLFDHEFKIKKYKNPNEILVEFMEIRLLQNKKRKEYLIETLSSEMEMINSKIRFIEMVIEGTLVIYKKTKTEIKESLEKNNFIKIKQTYNYLLELPIYTFSYEKIKELKDKYKELKESTDTVKSKTYKQMSIDDIENFKN